MSNNINIRATWKFLHSSSSFSSISETFSLNLSPTCSHAMEISQHSHIMYATTFDLRQICQSRHPSRGSMMPCERQSLTKAVIPLHIHSVRWSLFLQKQKSVMQLFMRMSSRNSVEQFFNFGFANKSVHKRFAFSSMAVSHSSDVSDAAAFLARHFALLLSSANARHESTNVDANWRERKMRERRREKQTKIRFSSIRLMLCAAKFRWNSLCVTDHLSM